MLIWSQDVILVYLSFAPHIISLSFRLFSYRSESLLLREPVYPSVWEAAVSVGRVLQLSCTLSHSGAEHRKPYDR